MKKIIQYMAAGLLLLTIGTGCEDNENWKVIPYVPEPPQTINITGTATIFTEAGETSLLKEVALDKGDGFDDKADVIGILTWLKAAGEFTITDSGIAFGKGDVVATDPLETVKLKEGGPAFKVAEDGLYYVLLNSADQQLTIVPAKIGVIGDATPDGWNGETPLAMAFDAATSVVSAKWSGDLTNKMLKYRFSGDWGVSLPYGNLKARVHTNFGGVADGVVLGDEMIELNAGGKDLKIAKNGAYDVEWTIDLNTKVVKGKAKLTKEGEGPVLPEAMFIIGSPYGPGTGWDWPSAYEMVPVRESAGKFWAIQYFKEGAEIKFNSIRDWGGEFGWNGNTPEESIAFGVLTDNNGNIRIGKAGWYLVVVTVADKTVVEFMEAAVYLQGDVATGGYDKPRLPENKFEIPLTADGEFKSPAFLQVPRPNEGVRMCIFLGEIGWYNTEFIILDGKIAFRGNGNDQTRVTGAVGQRAYLNFTTGAGRIE